MKLKHIKRFNENFKVNESTDEVEINSVSELYETYGSKYPHAVEAVAYFLFSDKESNILYEMVKDGKIDESELSEYMLGFENSWQYNLEQIDDYIYETFIKDK